MCRQELLDWLECLAVFQHPLPRRRKRRAVEVSAHQLVAESEPRSGQALLNGHIIFSTGNAAGRVGGRDALARRQILDHARPNRLKALALGIFSVSNAPYGTRCASLRGDEYRKARCDFGGDGLCVKIVLRVLQALDDGGKV